MGKLELRKEMKGGPPAMGRGPTIEDRRNQAMILPKEMLTSTAKVGNV
jgi:hypothetical protein